MSKMKKPIPAMWSFSRALQSKHKPVVLTSKGTGVTARLSKPSAAFTNGRFYAARTKPPEVYLLTEAQRKNLSKRIRPEQNYFCQRLLETGEHWDKDTPKDMHWWYELALQTLVRWRDSPEGSISNLRYKHLLKLWKQHGGSMWSRDKQGEYKYKRSYGWVVDQDYILELTHYQRRQDAQFFFCSHLGGKDKHCKNCGSALAVHAGSGNSSCFNRSCYRNLNKQGKSHYIRKVRQDLPVPATKGVRPNGTPEHVLNLGRKALEILEKVPGATELLQKHRLKKPKRSGRLAKAKLSEPVLEPINTNIHEDTNDADTEWERLVFGDRKTK